MKLNFTIKDNFQLKQKNYFNNYLKITTYKYLKVFYNYICKFV